MNFEDFFEKCLKEAHKDGYVIQKLSIVPQYRGRSWYKNIPYDQIFAMKKWERILYYIKDILRTLINISKMIFWK